MQLRIKGELLLQPGAARDIRFAMKVHLGSNLRATLTILLVLRSEMGPSADVITDRVLGTAGGALLIAAAPGQRPLLGGMIVAAAQSWPAFRVNVALGTATITVFVLLLGELLAVSSLAATHLLQDRLGRPWSDAASLWLVSGYAGFSIAQLQITPAAVKH